MSHAPQPETFTPPPTSYRMQRLKCVLMGRHQLRHLTRAHVLPLLFRPWRIGVPEPPILTPTATPQSHTCTDQYACAHSTLPTATYQFSRLVSVIVVQGKVQHDGCIAGRHANMWTLQLRRKCRLEARQRGSVANGSGCGHHEAPSQRAVRCKHGRCMRDGKRDECEQGTPASRAGQ